MMFGFGAFVLFSFVWFGYYTNEQHKEQELLKSELYSDAVRDWERIQAWYVRNQPKEYKLPHSMLIDRCLVAQEVTCWADRNGKLRMTEDMKPSDFITFVRHLKVFFRFEKSDLF